MIIFSASKTTSTTQMSLGHVACNCVLRVCVHVVLYVNVESFNRVLRSCSVTTRRCRVVIIVHETDDVQRHMCMCCGTLYSVCNVYRVLFRPWTEQIPVDSVFRVLAYNVQVYFREVRSFVRSF